MGTRCNIEIYDKWSEDWSCGVILYHHSDGYPDFMKGKLKRFLEKTFEILTEAGYPYWWDSERVAAVMIMLSIEDYENPLLPFSTNRSNSFEPRDPYRPNEGIPVFQPCLKLHGDIEYIYRIRLDPEKNGKFTISQKKV